jgi:hypothetical protein
MTDALNRLYDDVCRDFYAVLRENSMETRQTFFDQLAANIREVKAAHAEALDAARRARLGPSVSRHEPSERARRDVLYGLAGYESGDSEVVPEERPTVRCSRCGGPCRDIGANPICTGCYPSPPKNRLRRTP